MQINHDVEVDFLAEVENELRLICSFYNAYDKLDLRFGGVNSSEGHRCWLFCVELFEVPLGELWTLFDILDLVIT